MGAPGILAAGKLPSIRYVITLDADTQLPPGTARRMVETIAHPLNQVENRMPRRRCTRRRGFGIIQPRVSIALPGATATRFTRIFASTTGTDPYCQSVSDAQQDLFGEGIFHGKAIYDVRAFHETLDKRFPAETLLSHDLIEGSFVGVGSGQRYRAVRKSPARLCQLLPAAAPLDSRRLADRAVDISARCPQAAGAEGSEHPSADQPLADLRQFAPQPGGARVSAAAAVRLADVARARRLESGSWRRDRAARAGASARSCRAPSAGIAAGMAGRGR